VPVARPGRSSRARRTLSPPATRQPPGQAPSSGPADADPNLKTGGRGAAQATSTGLSLLKFEASKSSPVTTDVKPAWAPAACCPPESEAAPPSIYVDTQAAGRVICTDPDSENRLRLRLTVTAGPLCFQACPVRTVFWPVTPPVICDSVQASSVTATAGRRGAPVGNKRQPQSF
jgi:hypothetical protein